MPITLVTGLPGNGKTLYALQMVKERAEKENRQVFYSGIADLRLPWTEIEADKWYECPTNSIIVIDECQRVFRPRMHGKEVPKHVEELETHRHKGQDLVLITQHPMLADTALRRLTDRHLHVVRTFGTEAATVHEWRSVREQCDKPAAREDSEKHLWKYPKEVFTWYKSAEVHTVKRNIPKRLIMLAILPVILAGLGYMLYNSIMSRIEPEPEQQQQEQGGAAVGGMRVAAPGKDSQKYTYQNALHEAKQYAYDRTPRVTGLQHTAPAYDEIMKPKTVPLPVACVQSKTACKCFSQQATPVEVPLHICMHIVQNGYFDETKESYRHSMAPEKPIPVQSQAGPQGNVSRFVGG